MKWFAFGCSLLITACAFAQSADQFIHHVEDAHNGAAWDAHAAVQADITVDFGGQRMVEGQIIFDTPAGRSRVITQDGEVAAGFDGQTAWVAPADAEFPMARFHVLTWSYFAAMPFKLDDAGANLEVLGGTPWRAGDTLPAAKLTFDSGTGDTPDDWYIVYVDPDTHAMVGTAYIVTYGTATEDAEKEPHAATYDVTEVSGVNVPSKLVFYNWNETEGIHGEPIGEFTLSNIELLETVDEAFFNKPTDAREEALPGS